MKLIWKLFVAQARQHKVRLALTAFAMVSAIGVVLWVVSAYESIAANFDDQTSDFVGDYTAFVVPKYLEDALSPELVTALEENPAGEVVNPVSQFRMTFRRGGEPRTPPTEQPTGGRPNRGLGRMGPTIVGTNSHEPRYALEDGRWLNPESATEAVVSSGVAEALGIKPDDTIEFRSKSKEIVSLTVVGITKQVQDVEFAMSRTKGGAPGGTNRGPASLAAYVPMSVVEQLTGEPPKINLVELRLKSSAQVEQFSASVRTAAPAAEIIRREDVRAKISSGFAAEGARKQAYFVTALSILASAFIIFTTLSMGVSERARQLAVLRAVGLKRIQVAQLVLVEAMVLAVFGWVGGLAGGWLLLKALASAKPDLFPNGISLGGLSIVLTAACSLFGALLASLFPIWKAVRISPLEAMAPLQAQPRSQAWYGVIGLLSIALISINPVLVFWTALPETVRFILVLVVGAPGCVLGFILLAPIFVLLVERAFSPAVATALRLQSNLVKTQLSSNIWRSAGIAASLMLGLGLYTATQVWGYSMLGGFLPGRWTPNTIVKFDPGVPDETIDKVRQTEGVVPEICFPIAVEQAKVVGDPLGSGDRDSAIRQDNVTIIGIDAEDAFEKSPSAFHLQFVQGDRKTALAKLKDGRHCLMPESFLKLANLGVGDKIAFTLPKSPDKSVEYTIAGVLAEPGSNWITKTSGLRKNFVRTAGLVFAPRSQVQSDFAIAGTEFFWLQTKPGVKATELEERLKPLIAPQERGRLPSRPQTETASIDSPPAEKAESREPGRASRPVGPEGAAGEPPGRGGRGPGRGGPPDTPLRVTSIDDVRSSLNERGSTAIKAMGWLPLITLLVVSLGLINTIAASVRARQWEFGILRSVGLKRFALMRLVVAEALLIGFVASLLSFAFGLLTGWTCLGLIRYVSNPWFEGVATPLVIPWVMLAYGYGLAFLLCIVAALWPAIRVGHTEPLQLLQGGRSAI